MIGERLADLRKDKRLKQKELADILKVSLHTLSNYETGKSTPDDETKIQISRLFNVSLDYLLGVIDEQKPIESANTIFLSESLPKEAMKEIKDFIEYIKIKYK